MVTCDKFTKNTRKYQKGILTDNNYFHATYRKKYLLLWLSCPDPEGEGPGFRKTEKKCCQLDLDHHLTKISGSTHGFADI